MKKTKTIITLLLIVCMTFSVCGCSNEKGNITNKYNLPKNLSTVKSSVIDENDRFALSWDLDNSTITVLDKQTGKNWCSVPYEYISNGVGNSKYVNNGLQSGIVVTYHDSKKNSEAEASSYSNADYIIAKKTKNGLRLIYYFDTLKFSIPLLFKLEEDGVSVSLEISKISEKENKVIAVSVLPFFASCKNNTDSYIFVPDGSGAIMNVDDNVRTPRYYNKEIYGDDATSQTIYKTELSKQVLLPVFGVKDRENALLGIVTKGAETAKVKAVVGDSQYGYSGVCADFKVRGKSVSYLKTSGGTNNEVSKYTDGFVNLPKATVKYVFLDSDKANYNGMASAYKQYLVKEYKLKNSVETPDVFFNVLGGYYITKSFFGIPYRSLTSLTTCDEAKAILKDVNSKTKASFAVNLRGFTESGLDYGKVAGGYKTAGLFGGQKAMSELTNWCAKNGGNAFVDYDLINFNESSGGFSVRRSATTVNDTRAVVYDYLLATHAQDTSGRKAFLVNREKLATSAEKIAEKVSKTGIKGASFTTLSNTAFSDNRSDYYFCKAHMTEDVQRILKKIRKNGISTFGSNANVYSAVYLDYIFDTPLSSSKYYSTDIDIPFYQMVFKGLVAMSGEPINISANERLTYLKSVSVGASLGFTVCDHVYDSQYSSVHSSASLGVYSGIDEKICEYINEAKPLLLKIRDTGIKSYEISSDVSKTVFENGVVLYVNYGDNAAETELGTVNAQSFVYR